MTCKDPLLVPLTASLCPQRWQWQHPLNQRYYVADLHQDLLGDWVLTQVWGVQGS